MTTQLLQISDRVRVGGKLGAVVAVEPRPRATIYTIAFTKGLPQKFISPPTTIEKIYSPIELLKSTDFDSPIRFDLHFEASRLSLAYEYDHLLSLSSTRTNLEPYQVEAVHKVLNSYKQRFLIADDVGLGKTIEAGMILKELALRGRAKRVLIIVPAPLRYQWQREMRERFDENFIIYDSFYLRALKDSLGKAANVWDAHRKIITSLDYAKREEVLVELERTEWDFIIFDEAHKLSASKYGNKIERSQRFRLSERLRDNTESLILLTGTPHRGDSFAFYSLISLVDPYIFENETSISFPKLNSIMIRRGKEGLRDENGNPVFRPRKVFTLPVHFTDTEKKLYDAVTNYVRNIYNTAKFQNNRAVGFAMVLFQKRMVSSIAAIKQSLKNRLSNLIKGEVTSLTKEEQVRLRDYIEDPDSMDDWERERFEKKLEVLALPATPEALKTEIASLEILIKMAERIRVDSKARRLIEFVKGVLEDAREKVLIFTEYRDTLRYLVDLLQREGFSPVIIHGGMSMGERREAEELFRSGPIRVLVATDAAGEGINLQFCHIMVNYDLPWNPNRIDQRIGRLHRYGQKRDVKVHNLFVSNTREGQILGRLFQKISLIERELGGKISDILGVVLEGVKLDELIMDALAENKSAEVTSRDIEKAIEDRKYAYQKIESSFLMNLKKFDLEGTLKVIEKSKDRSASEGDIENFVKTFFKLLGGRIELTRKRGIYRLYPPKDILSKEVKEKYEKITFSRELAKTLGSEQTEFLAFGHPLLEAVIDYAKDKTWTFGGRVTVKVLKEIKNPGLLFNFIMKFMDGTGKLLNEEVLPFFIDVEQKVKQLNPKEIVNFLNTSEESITNPLTQNLIEKSNEFLEKVKDFAIRKARVYCSEVQKKKDREMNIKRGDARRYFEIRLKEERRRISEYKTSLFKGKDMEIAIRAAEKRMQDLNIQYKKVLDNLEEEGVVFEEMPELISCAVILPG